MPSPHRCPGSSRAVARRGVTAALAAGLTLALIPACSSSSAPSAPPPSGPDVVTIKDVNYSPKQLSVHIGDTVAWVFSDGDIPHNVDGASDLNDFDSGNPQTKGVYRYTFKKAGTYQYHCDVHPGMVGTVNVSS